MTEDQLRQILPLCDATDLIDPINSVFAEFAISTPLRQAAFLATVGHESSQLRIYEENLNYSADALIKLFPMHFTPEQAANYARQPERIANRLYANRGGNGDEASGDGWKRRGSGDIQITFHDNHKACADYFGMSLDTFSAWARTRAGALRSAGWFWWKNKLNGWADTGDFDGVSDVVNRGKKTAAVGDSIGWAERFAFYNKAKQVLGC